VVRFTDEEIVHEVERMAAEARGTAFSAGASIYHQLPLCINPARLRDADAARLLEDYRLCQALGVPPAQTLDEVPAMYADAVLVIRHELGHIERELARAKEG